MESFLKIDNFKKCLAAMQNYMSEKYDVDISSITTIKQEDVLYTIMKQVAKENKDMDYPIVQLNNIALNMMRDVYVEKLKLIRQNKPAVKSLERETKVFGDRPLYSNNMLPTNTQTSKDTITKEYDRILQHRKNETSVAIPTAPKDIQGANETAIDIDDFQKKLATLEKQRDDYLMQNIALQKPIVPDDPKSFFTGPSITKPAIVEEPKTPAFVNHAQHDLIPQQAKRLLEDRYVTINGFDRKWWTQPNRYSFNVDMNQLSQNYKNIASIRFTNMIIPMEIEEVQTLTNMPKASYFNGIKLAHPYLMLHVDELGNVYDGFNQQVRKCCTTFVYDTSFKSPNGRGFIIMRPLQGEMKNYLPRALGTLNRLTFAVVKPNGALFNTSIDGYKIRMVDYQQYNAQYVQVVLDRFFDKNEFFIGDTILFKGFTIMLKNIPPESCLDAGSFSSVSDWICRNEGHEISELGTMNTDGFTNTFFIPAPTTFDQNDGKIVIDKKKVDALYYYNLAAPNNRIDGLGTNNEQANLVINSSLQLTLSMTITVSTNDSSVIGTDMV